MGEGEEEKLETLIEKTLKSAQTGQVKKLYARREELNGDNAQILLAAFNNALFCRSDEGRKLLSYLFSLLDVETIHKAIKKALPTAAKTTATHYGQIYYRAWKYAANDDDKRTLIEQLCIQDLIALAVQCTHTHTVNILRLTIKAWTTKKSERQMECMLARALQPILWRHLEMPNCKVRLNAASLLFVMYPVRDSELPAPDREELNRRQHTAALMLLEDPSAAVRVVSIRGVCQMMTSLWSALSSDFIKQALVKIVDRLSKDRTSVHVRVAAFEGLRKLLDCNGAVDVMKKLLPKVVRFGINDQSALVRGSACDILLALRGNRLIKFWQVIEVKTELLPRLAVESCQKVAKTIVKILFPSYCPTAMGVDARMYRTVDLVSANLDAARIFFRFAGGIMPASEAAEHIKAILQFVYMQVRAEDEASDTQSNASTCNELLTAGVAELNLDQQNLGDDDCPAGIGNAVNYSARNFLLMNGLIDCCGILWTSVRGQLYQQSNQNEWLVLKRFAARILPRLLKFYSDDKRIYEALLYLCTLLSKDDISGNLCDSVMDKLRHLEERKLQKLQTDREQRVLLEAASAWQFDELVQMISDWLLDPLNVENTQTSKRRKKAVKAGEQQPRPGVGVRYLLALLNSPTTRQRLLCEYKHILAILFGRLERVRQPIDSHLTAALNASNDQQPLPMSFSELLLCISLQWSIAMILVTDHNNDGDDDDDRSEQREWLNAQMTWMNEKVVVHLVALSETAIADDVFALIKTMLHGARGALLAGICSEAFEELVTDAVRHLLDRDETVPVLGDLVDTLLQVVDAIHFSDVQPRMITVVCPAVESLLRFLIGLLGNATPPVLDCAKSLHNLLVAVCCRGSMEMRARCSDAVLLPVMVASLNDLTASITREQTVGNPRTEDFTCPALTELLIRKVVAKNPTLTLGVTTKLLACIEADMLEMTETPLMQLGGAAQLLALLKTKSTEQRRCKEALLDQLDALEQDWHDDDLFAEVAALLS